MLHLAETPAAKRWLEICRDPAFADRPERFEIDQKRALYFNAGATEVWICNLDGSMLFFVSPVRQESDSLLFPAFPDRIS
jgi:hypothetical protein